MFIYYFRFGCPDSSAHLCTISQWRLRTECCGRCVMSTLGELFHCSYFFLVFEHILRCTREDCFSIVWSGSRSVFALCSEESSNYSWKSHIFASWTNPSPNPSVFFQHMRAIQGCVSAFWAVYKALERRGVCSSCCIVCWRTRRGGTIGYYANWSRNQKIKNYQRIRANGHYATNDHGEKRVSRKQI